MLDQVTAELPGADRGFTLIFSPQPFPGHQVELQWRKEEYGGNWYHCPQLNVEGWLCPALFKYFEAAPERLFARAEKKRA